MFVKQGDYIEAGQPIVQTDDSNCLGILRIQRKRMATRPCWVYRRRDRLYVSTAEEFCKFLRDAKSDTMFLHLKQTGNQIRCQDPQPSKPSPCREN